MLHGKMIRISAVAVVVGAAALAVACGDDDDDGGAATASPTVATATASPDGGASGSVPSSGSVAPNTFLTYEGEQYRLVELLQADLIDESAFEEAGEATEVDIDQEDLTVYTKTDDPDAVYTFSPGAESDQVGEGIPALWYRWSLEPAE